MRQISKWRQIYCFRIHNAYSCWWSRRSMRQPKLFPKNTNGLYDGNVCWHGLWPTFWRFWWPQTWPQRPRTYETSWSSYGPRWWNFWHLYVDRNGSAMLKKEHAKLPKTLSRLFSNNLYSKVMRHFSVVSYIICDVFQKYIVNL